MKEQPENGEPDTRSKAAREAAGLWGNQDPKSPFKTRGVWEKKATKNSGVKAKLQTAHGADKEQQVLGTCPTSGGGREQISERIHVRFSYVK